MALLLFEPLAACLWVGFGYDYDVHYPTLNYYVGFETGFGGRKLIGTIAYFLFGNHIGSNQIALMVLTANALTAVGFWWLVVRCIRTISKQTMPVVAMLALYLLSPFSLLKVMDGQQGISLIFMEIYMLVAVLTWMLAFTYKRRGFWFYLLTAVVALFCCLVHHTFCCLLLPPMVALMIGEVMDGGFRWRKAVAYVISLLPMAVAFVAIVLCGGMNTDIESLLEQIQVRAGGGSVEGALQDRMGIEVLYYYSQWENRRWAFEGMGMWIATLGIIEVIMLSPILTVMVWPWMKAAKLSTTAVVRGRYWLMVVADVVLTLPIFFMAFDNGRFWSCYFVGMAMMMLVEWHSGREEFRTAMARLWAVAKRYWWWTALLVIYATTLHLGGWAGLAEAIKLRKLIFLLI
ncbi:MAG: hypothetical protein IJU19_05605 [Bacteroidales bacterium]|nr:hypothetical protein [Bacteroidales bacterium]